MTEQTPDSKVDNETESDPGKWAFVGFIAGVIVTVFALQYYGYVVFPKNSALHCSLSELSLAQFGQLIA